MYCEVVMCSRQSSIHPPVPLKIIKLQLLSKGMFPYL